MEENEVQKVTEVTTSVPHQVVTTTKKVVGDPLIKTDHPQKVFETKKTILRSFQIIWYILGLIEVLLAFRIFFKVIGANSTSGFTKLIYAMSDPFSVPFFSVVSPTISGASIIEWSTIIAMLVYVIFAYGLISLFQLVKPLTPKEVEQSV